MNTTKFETLFSLRYAVRVLERYARMWGISGAVLKFISIMSGTVALASMMAKVPDIALILGVVFAAAQALEVTLSPADKRAEALAQRKDYARLLARQSSMTFDQLESAYQALVADDAIEVRQGLKELAYNDVVMEQGLSKSDCYADHFFLRLCS